MASSVAWLEKEADVTRTLIQGGKVVTATETSDADVLIEGEKVVALLSRGTEAPPVDQVLDASDRLVFPGSIDAHTHMEIPFGAATSKDTFETGTRATNFLAVAFTWPPVSCDGGMFVLSPM